MTTMKTIAQKTTTRTLVICDEKCNIHDIVAMNVDIDTICTIEKYFDFSKLIGEIYLVEIIEENGSHYFRTVWAYGWEDGLSKIA